MFTLRPALYSDAATIKRIVRQAHINPMDLDWQRFVLAVADNGEVIGTVQIKPHKDGTHELASLAVVPEWQGKGVARGLIEHMFEKHPGTLYLMCRDVLTPLYTKFGFSVLEPADMPKHYLQMYTLVGRMQRLFRRPERLAIMRRSG